MCSWGYSLPRNRMYSGIMAPPPPMPPPAAMNSTKNVRMKPEISPVASKSLVNLLRRLKLRVAVKMAKSQGELRHSSSSSCSSSQRLWISSFPSSPSNTPKMEWQALPTAHLQKAGIGPCALHLGSDAKSFAVVPECHI